MAKIKISLDTKQIQKTIDRLNKLKENIKNDVKETISETVDEGIREIEYNYAETKYKDGNDDYSVDGIKDLTNGQIMAYGKQVFYDEYGTGTQGEDSPHPFKSISGLNAYNSGKYIKPSKKYGGLGWRYKNKSGETIWTNGIPAGMQVFKASRVLKRSFSKRLEKKVGDSISRV